MRLRVVCGAEIQLVCVPHTPACGTCIDQGMLAVLFLLDKSAADTLLLFVTLYFLLSCKSVFAESFRTLNAGAGQRDRVFCAVWEEMGSLQTAVINFGLPRTAV